MIAPKTIRPQPNRVLKSLLKEKQAHHSFLGPNFMTRIGLSDNDNNLQMINIEDIIYIESNGNVTNVIVDGFEKRFIVFDSLKSFESRLSRFNFFRSHRSFLINLNKVMRYNYRKDKGRKIRLDNDKCVSVSDDRKRELKRKLQLL